MKKVSIMLLISVVAIFFLLPLGLSETQFDDDGQPIFPDVPILDLSDRFQTRYHIYYLLKNQSEGAYAEGKYKVGGAIEAGLYTFILQPNENGSISVGREDGREIISLGGAGEAEYTLYLPENANIEIAGCGLLTKIKEVAEYQSRKEVYTPNGRYLLGVQAPFLSYTIRAAENTPARVILSDFSHEVYGDSGKNVLVIEVNAGEERTIDLVEVLPDVFFVEFQDCYVLPLIGVG